MLCSGHLETVDMAADSPMGLITVISNKASHSVAHCRCARRGLARSWSHPRNEPSPIAVSRIYKALLPP